MHEVAILDLAGKKIAYWEVWDSHNTKAEALSDLKREFRQRPSWVTAKFHKATNRIRKYVPAERS